MRSPASRTIVIVGGGFSGTVAAANLLRAPGAGELKVVLLERSGDIGRGVAYARRKFPFILNVPAARMSASSSNPAGFLQFVRESDAHVTGQDFLSRERYGDYLAQYLRAAAASAPASVRLETLSNEVTALSRDGAGGPFRVALAHGDALSADCVVLAPGNPPPRAPVEAASAWNAPGFINDPWAPATSVPPGPALILGTGLTMVDVVCARLKAQPSAPIDALSRHGLLPLSQTDVGIRSASVEQLATVLRPGTPLRLLVRQITAAARAAVARGEDWRDVIMAVRHSAPELWQSLDLRDRRRFLTHVRAYWDVHRHRFPEPIRDTLKQLQVKGQLRLRAGRVLEIAPFGERLRVIWRARGERETRESLYNAVYNATGPDYDIGRSPEPLWRSLLEAGLVAQDELRLGIRTTGVGQAVGADSQPTPGLYYLGPLLRARYWEATAVAELRGHAERLAAHLVAPR